jgi:hypothetical protein
MDRKVRESKYVLMVCTEPYYHRVMGEEEPGKGLGIRWEGHLIYQHLYSAGAINRRFIPVIFSADHRRFIPTPVQGATYYDLSTPHGYDDLYGRLTDQPKAEKPQLGRRRPLPTRPVKTNPAMFLSTPIDIDLWNEAKWSATFFSYQEGRPPILGLAFLHEAPARKIFEGWHERYGVNDKYEELRISIVEGVVPGEPSGYTVHVGPDPEVAIQRFKVAGYAFDKDLLVGVSRLNRMTPPPESKNLAMFKELYASYKTYYLVPGVVSEDGKKLKPMFELGIYKSKVLFRHVSDIHAGDLDSVVLGSGKIARGSTPFPRH